MRLKNCELPKPYGQHFVRLPSGKFWLPRNVHFAHGPGVPAGFEWNGCSSPKWCEMLGIGNDDDAQVLASAQHDAIYGDYGGMYTKINQHRADRLFALNLLRMGVPLDKVKLIYVALRAFGSFYWRAD